MYLSKIKSALIIAAGFLISNVAMAIPTLENNSNGDGEEAGLFAYASGWFQDLIQFGVPAVLACCFAWMMWELWAKVQEQRSSKQPEWNGVIAFSGASVGYFVVATYIGYVRLNMFATAA